MRNKALPAEGTAGGPDASLSYARGGLPSRAGKVPVAGFFDPAVRRALKLLAVERACSQQEVLSQALRMLFADAVLRGSAAVRSMPPDLPG